MLLSHSAPFFLSLRWFLESTLQPHLSEPKTTMPGVVPCVPLGQSGSSLQGKEQWPDIRSPPAQRPLPDKA